MTTSDHLHWQTRHSVKDSQWADLRRRSRYISPITGLILFATGYAYAYAASHLDEWFPSTTSLLIFRMFLARLGLTALAPAILSLIGLSFIYRQANRFIKNMYKPTDDENISKLLKRALLGVPPYPPPLGSFMKYPSLVIDKASPLGERHWAHWFGGPAVLVIHDGFAVYLEQGGQFSRALGPGAPTPVLARHETIKEIVDLKPQIKEGEVKPWTKDGINITLQIHAELQIYASEEALDRSQNFRYPFDPLAVKQVVEGISVSLNDKHNLTESGWLDSAWGAVTGTINRFVSGHSLDELFLAPLDEYNAALSRHANAPREAIEQILSKKISDSVIADVQRQLKANGFTLLDLQITKIEVPTDVQTVREKYWESLHKKISAERNSLAEAEWIRARESIHAEAQRTMLATIIKRLEPVPEEQLTEALTLSLSGILDQNLEDPLIRPLIAKETLAVLDRIRKFLNEAF